MKPNNKPKATKQKPPQIRRTTISLERSAFQKIKSLRSDEVMHSGNSQAIKRCIIFTYNFTNPDSPHYDEKLAAAYAGLCEKNNKRKRRSKFPY